MAKMFIIAGHGAGDPGAIGNGYNEAERVRALARRIKELGGDSVLLGDFNRNYYADNGISTLNISKEYCIVELHMDSNVNATARGGHVIILEGFEPDDYDRALATMLQNTLPGRAQMIVGRGDLANPSRAAAKGYNYRLLECGFISNATDVNIFNTRMDEIAAGILSAFGIKASGGSSSGSSTSTPNNPVKPTVSNLKDLGQVDTSYKAKTTCWWPEVNNREDWAGAGDNVPVTAFMLKVSKGYAIYRAHANGVWFDPIDTRDKRNYNENDGVYGFAGDGVSPIDAIVIYYYTPDGYLYKRAMYRVSDSTGDQFYPVQIDDETGAGMDGYAGVIGNFIDKLQIWID